MKKTLMYLKIATASVLLIKVIIDLVRFILGV